MNRETFIPFAVFVVITLVITRSVSADDRPGIERASEFWAFKPPKKPTSPVVRNTSWPRSEIDLFLLAKLERNGISPVEDASRFTLLRRATLDLVGLPPSTQEIDAFLADSSPNAFATVVDRLLQSPEFGERWARHWLDLMQYADTTGYVWSRPLFNAYRYRDYVVRSFNDDKPYN